MGAFSFGSSGLQRRQLNVGSRFIYHHQAPGVHLLHLLTPLSSFVLAALAGCQCLFFLEWQASLENVLLGDQRRLIPAFLARKMLLGFSSPMLIKTVYSEFASLKRGLPF